MALLSQSMGRRNRGFTMAPGSQAQVHREKPEIRGLAPSVLEDLPRGRVIEGSLDCQERTGTPREHHLKDPRDGARLRHPGGNEDAASGAVDRVALPQAPEEIDSDLGGEGPGEIPSEIGMDVVGV